MFLNSNFTIVKDSSIPRDTIVNMSTGSFLLLLEESENERERGREREREREREKGRESVRGRGRKWDRRGTS